jgi:hypothetical protein
MRNTYTIHLATMYCIPPHSATFRYIRIQSNTEYCKIHYKYIRNTPLIHPILLRENPTEFEGKPHFSPPAGEDGRTQYRRTDEHEGRHKRPTPSPIRELRVHPPAARVGRVGPYIAPIAGTLATVDTPSRAHSARIRICPAPPCLVRRW